MIIEKITHNKTYYTILFDDSYSIRVHEDMMLKHKLRTKKELTPVEVSKLEEEYLVYKVYDKALRFAKYEKSEYEVRKYLESKVSFSDAEFIIERLKKLKIINDLKIVNKMVNQKYSKLELKARLYSKKIGPSLYTEVLDEYDEDEAIIKEIQKKSKKYDDPKKLYAYLYRKGFNRDLINKYLNINLD